MRYTIKSIIKVVRIRYQVQQQYSTWYMVSCGKTFFPPEWKRFQNQRNKGAYVLVYRLIKHAPVSRTTVRAITREAFLWHSLWLPQVRFLTKTGQTIP